MQTSGHYQSAIGQQPARPDYIPESDWSKLSEETQKSIAKTATSGTPAVPSSGVTTPKLSLNDKDDLVKKTADIGSKHLGELTKNLEQQQGKQAQIENVAKVALQAEATKIAQQRQPPTPPPHYGIQMGKVAGIPPQQQQYQPPPQQQHYQPPPQQQQATSSTIDDAQKGKLRIMV